MVDKLQTKIKIISIRNASYSQEWSRKPAYDTHNVAVISLNGL